MKSKVHAIYFTEGDSFTDKIIKLELLLDTVKPFSIYGMQDSVSIKMHFGEEGNTGHIKPSMVKPLIDRLKRSCAHAILTDTNALYKGRRTTSALHVRLAAEHGFVRDATGSDIAIAEGDLGKDVTDVVVEGVKIKTAKIASLFLKNSGLVGLSHFKGHLLTGFGGTIKNIGMGCASREGKLEQHCEVAPIINGKTCISCGACVEACPPHAITIKADCASIDGDTCIGCAECIASCPQGAITVDFYSGKDHIQERMAEYAKAALFGKQGKAVFINIAMSISQECDCFTQNFPSISDDVGIFLSNDPVAVDTAAYDAIVRANARDVFKQAHPDIDCMKQLRHGERIGLGSMSYDLSVV